MHPTTAATRRMSLATTVRFPPTSTEVPWYFRFMPRGMREDREAAMIRSLDWDSALGQGRN
jgi:hypothetical protein